MDTSASGIAQEADTQGLSVAPAEELAGAVALSETLNTALLETQAERSYNDLQNRYQLLMKQCSDYQSQISNLETNVDELRAALRVKTDQVETMGEQIKRGNNETQRAQEREKDVCERMSRLDVEADSLRQEISRLSASNQGLSAQITQLEASAKLSTSSTAPLQFENSRLKTELASLNAHCDWLEKELNHRSNQGADEKVKNLKLIQELRTELNDIRADYDEAISRVSLLSMQNETLKKRIEMGQKELLQKEQDHADIVHELSLEIQAERRLVTLNKENYSRLEERYNGAVREIKSMKEMAIAAEKDRQDEIVEIREQLESHYKNLLEETEQETLNRIEQYQQELDAVILEKTELEDKFMAGDARRALTMGEHEEVLQSSDHEPMTLTTLYEKLANAEDETRRERAERKRLELYLERVNRDIERQLPRQRQERKEYELAVSQNQEMHSRLNEALEESNAARREYQQLQRELTEMNRECNELRLENKDMALQVQNLLQKSLDGEDLAAEIQSQNQRMLKEHHRMSLTISELNKRIDNDRVQQQIEELEALRRERENQALLVSNIIHQRDLYRALLIKNDQSLLAEYGADGSIIAAKDQIEKFTELESRNKELEQTVSKLNAEISSFRNEKFGLDEKLARFDAYCRELSTANKQLETDLCASRSATSRNNAECKFYKEKVQRLEESLDMLRDEAGRVNDDKKQLRRLCEELQSMLSSSKDEQSKLESQLKTTSSQLRLAETNYKALKEAEIRLTADNVSLRSELARYISLHESMQSIESNLRMNSNDEQRRLKDEVTKLTSSLQTERSEHVNQIEDLRRKVEDMELHLRLAEKEKAEALAKTISSKDELATTSDELKSIRDKYALIVKELDDVKSKANIEMSSESDREMIKDLTTELGKTKTNLEAALKRAEDYKAIAHSNEMTLKASCDASEEFKKSALDEIEKLKHNLATATELATMKQNLLAELSKDLENSREEFQKNSEELQAKLVSLTAELDTCRCDKETSEQQRDCVLEEMQIYRNEAISAKDNYERELALHAEARRELHDIRGKLDEETRAHTSTKDQLKNLQNLLNSERNAWEESKRNLSEAQKDTEDRLKEAHAQIEILHNQYARLNQSLEKVHPDRRPSAEDETSTNPISNLEKEIIELRQVISFQQNEKSLIEAQLESARRTAERERAAAEIARHSLNDLRCEFEVQQELYKKGGADSSNADATSPLDNKLKAAEEQLILLRESNAMLRNETEKLNKALELSNKETMVAKAAVEPTNRKYIALEVEKSALEAEKASLAREVGAWKDRVHNLLTKFNQIDPEEYANAVKKAECAEERCAELLASKEKSDKDAATAKALISRLNKEITKLRSALDSANASLSKAKTENEDLLKSSTGSVESMKKDIDDMKRDKEQAEKDLSAAKTEIIALNARLENLKNISRSNKAKVLETQKNLESALKKEKEISKLLEEEKEAHKATLKQAEQYKATSKVNVEPSKQTMLPEAHSNNAANAEIPWKEGKPVVESQIESIGDGALPVLRVPDEGFNFAPSKTSTRLAELAQTKSIDGGTCSVEDQSQTSNDPRAKKDSATEAKLPLQVAEKVGNIEDEGKQKTNDTNQMNKSQSDLDSLRAKLFKKKRSLEMKLGAPPAKRHAPGESGSAVTNNDVTMKDISSDKDAGEKRNIETLDEPLSSKLRDDTKPIDHVETASKPGGAALDTIIANDAVVDVTCSIDDVEKSEEITVDDKIFHLKANKPITDGSVLNPTSSETGSQIVGDDAESNLLPKSSNETHTAPVLVADAAEEKETAEEDMKTDDLSKDEGTSDESKRP